EFSRVLFRSIPDEGGGDHDWACAHAIVALGRTLGLTIVAEGIEQPGQRDRLRELGCDRGQGYLFGRPVAADKIPKLVARVNASAEGPRRLTLSDGRVA